MQIKQILACFACLMFLTITLRAQQPLYYEALGLYSEAQELFDKAKYGAAQQKFSDFIDRSETLNNYPEADRRIPEARFLNALCAFNLLRNNAANLFEEFILLYPDHAKVNEARFYIGKLHFLKKDFELAIPALEAVNRSGLSSADADEAAYMLGFAHYKSGDKGRALPLFDAVRSHSSEHAKWSAYYYGLIQYEDGNYRAAYDALLPLEQEKDFQKAGVPVLMANALLKLGDYEALNALGDRMMAENPPTELFLILANAAYEQENYEKSVDFFRQYTKKSGKLDRTGNYRYGFALFQTGSHEAAVDYLKRVLQPEDELTQNAMYFLGHAYLKLNDRENALAAFGKASGIDGMLKEKALFDYAKVAMETRFYDEALDALKELKTDYPESDFIEEANTMSGEILLLSNDFKGAVEYYETTSLKSERAKKGYQRASFYRGIELYEKGLYDQAEDYFKKAYNLRYDQDLVSSAYYWSAESMFRREQYQQAISQFRVYLDQPAVHKHREYARAWYGIAWSYFKLAADAQVESRRMDYYSQASENFEKFIGVAKKDEQPQLLIDAYLRAGDAEFVNKNYANALNYYLQVRNMDHGNVDYALFQTGRTYQRLHKYEEAVQYLRKLADQHKASEYRDDALDLLSELYLTWLRDWYNARVYGEKFLQDYPQNPKVPSILNRIGLAYVRSEDEKAAEKYFKRVLTDYCRDEKAVEVAISIMQQIQEPAAFEQTYQLLKQNCPDVSVNHEVVFNQAMSRFFAEDYQQAIEQYTSYIRDYPTGSFTWSAHYHRGLSHQKLGNVQKALEDYQVVYSTDVINEYTLKALKESADLQFEQENFLASLELFSRLEEMSDKLENKLVAQFGQASIHMIMENYAEARKVLMQIYTHPNVTEYSRNRAHLNLAIAMYGMDDLEAAKQEFLKIEEKNSDSFAAEAAYYVAQILYDQEKYDEAVKAAKLVKEKYSSYNYWKAKAFLVMGDAFDKQGNSLQAEYIFKSLVNLEFEDIRNYAQQRYEEIAAKNLGGNNPDDSLETGGGDE